MIQLLNRLLVLALVLTSLVGCSGGGGGGGRGSASAAVESCMTCHNASLQNDYKGPGILNPHPFPGAAKIKCTVCHGGNPLGEDKDSSHVPPPPDIGDDQNLIDDDHAYFNRLTLTGLDKLDDYQVGGKTYTALDYLQFINPGDLRVVAQGKSCGQCHMSHVDCVTASPLATSTGILSGALFAIGQENQVPESVDLYQDTAADLGFRDITDPNYVLDPSNTGMVGRLLEFPVFSVKGGTGQPTDMDGSDLYDAGGLVNDIDPVTKSVVSNSPLANLYHEQVAFTCGDCHLGSAGANNRTGDYRSSGCTACHMPYSLGGRYEGIDPNVNRLEPADPDDIEAPERAHVRQHQIVSVRKTLPSGIEIQGMDDYTCAGCHQGSNRTVMQYWGIRLDQNEDLDDGFQYPAQPLGGFVDTRNDTRLFDPVLGNREFNGRRDRQYILFEDYDGDGLDDTPPDVHYEAGLGCIDCHGSHDLHGGDVTANGFEIASRMEQAISIRCESCHGSADAYADTDFGQTYDGQNAELAVDAEGNVLRHVVKEADGHFYLYSRLTGAKHFVPQTMDTVVDTDVVDPFTSEEVYSPLASYAMGRADGDPATGIGPMQDFTDTADRFSHADSMDCAACHSSWTNTCMGCHLEGEYRNNGEFSNITGDEIVFRERNADFVYQSPIPFQLGVGPDNKITQMSANTKMFFSYRDRHGTFSDVFAFSDRNQAGGAPGSAIPPVKLPALSHNAMMAHSIRGKVRTDPTEGPLYEGPRYCVACHLTEDGLDAFGRDNYKDFRDDMRDGNFASLDFGQLQTQIGLNPGNQLNSPLWVHMVAGLGSGLFLFDEDGCAMNTLDNNPNRAGCDQAPASVAFDPTKVAYNLDRIVEEDGTSNSSNNHPMLDPGEGLELRMGAQDPNLSGPLGGDIITRLADHENGIVLDSWIDADGDTGGNADAHIP